MSSRCAAANRLCQLPNAVVEMIHTATLVHDDILDDAGVRLARADSERRLGEHNAVLLGDDLFTHAFHLASTLDDVVRAG